MSLEYPFDYIFVFILGTLFGSFANVCIYRLPQRLSIIFPGSHCPFCQEALRPWQNIPLLSYLLLGGQCVKCKRTISLRYPLIELSNGLLYVFLYYQYHLSMQTVVFALLTTTLLIVSCIDLAHTIIPDAITLPGIVVGLGTSLWLTPVGLRNALLGVVLGGGLFLWQKRNEQKAPVATETATQPAPSPRQTYEHDWAKHSLDTTHSVIQQIQRQRKDDDLKDAVGRR